MALNIYIRQFLTTKVIGNMLRRAAHFGPLKISDSISQHLTEKKIVRPSEIQEKAMVPILDGQDIIVNSETGSGKTLCYLLPIIEKIKQSQKTFQNKILSSSCAMIFAPTLELAEQIGSVCKELGQTEISIACGNSPLRVKENTQMIITLPSILMNYDWKSLSKIKFIVFDEADSMLVERFAEVRKLLEFYTGRKTYFSRGEKRRQKIKASKRKYVFLTASEKPQFVFVGATIPSGGSKTALSLIEKFVPSAKLIQSFETHKVVPRTKFEFVDVVNDFKTKFVALAKVLENEISAKNVMENVPRNTFRAIIFTNKVSDAKQLYAELIKDDKKLLLDSKYIYRDYDRNSEAQEDVKMNQTDNSALSDNNRKSLSNSEMTNIKEFREKWKNSFCILHSGMTSSERLDVLRGLAKGRYNALITTNLASRGLDIPNVDVIIQFDFATNIAAILHRAGRTARAGAEGKVINFISEKDKDLCELFRATIDKDENVSRLFSRRRRLRLRIKRRSQTINDNVENSIS